ncbi:MAG TPA: hypothetical protein VFD71_17580 [Planctomycetota bacterium]|nr:hypothetical protein [Planctomycetota bacterium]
MTAEVGSRALPEWLLRLLSVDTERLQGGTEHVRFARFPEGVWGLVALLAIAAAFAWVVWNYQREGQVARWRKNSMAALRCAVLAAAALMVFYPVLEVDRAAELRATTILLVDGSLSQGIKDRYRGDPARRDALALALKMKPEEVEASTRAELARRALEDPSAAVIDRLEKANRLRAYSFSGLPLEPLEASRQGAARKLEWQTAGAITDAAGALRAAVEDEGGGRVAGIVLVSDGRVTAGEDLKSAGAYLVSKGIPVHAVGVGDPTPARNFRVTAVLGSERVFAGDPIVIDVRLDQQGFPGEPVRVELLDSFEPQGEAARPPAKVESQDVTFREAAVDAATAEAPDRIVRSEATASFRFEPKGVGRHRLVARIEPRPEETFAEDNERALTVEVVKDASKVLLISGGPTYEYRFLKNLLRRDSRVSVAGWLMSADADYPQEGNVSLKKLPDTEKDLFEYDVVILMDIDPLGMPAGFAKLLEEFVGRHRGGLVFAAGEKYGASLFDAADATPIRDMLPVSIDEAQLKDEIERGRFYEKSWPLVPTAAALSHAATRLSSQLDRNRDRWAEIAPVYWTFPVRKAKPGAVVLFEHSDPSLARDGQPRPVVAFQFYEGGRVMWCGLNSTWRWRATAEEVYDRFWIQSIRYLMENRLSGDRRRLIQTDKDGYDLGDSIRVSALVTDEAYRPLDAEEQVVLLEAPGSPPQELRLQREPSAPGWFRGVFAPRVTGDHKLTLPGASGGDVEKLVHVDPPQVEFESPRLDEPALQELASMTQGSYVPLAELRAVPDRILDKRQTIVTTDEPIPLWDNWLSMSILAGLLTIEWIFRKLSRLL